MRRILAFLVLLLFISPGLRALDSTLIYHDSTYISKEPVRPLIELDEESTGLQSGICGTSLREALVVRVKDDRGIPLEGYQVVFSIMSGPDQAEGAGLNETQVLTDSTGRASTELTLGSRPGLYQVSCRIEGGFPDNEVVFRVKASKKNWIWMLIIGLFGGLGLFLFGMHTMSEGMQQSAGERMRSILEQVTGIDWWEWVSEPWSLPSSRALQPPLSCWFPLSMRV